MRDEILGATRAFVDEAFVQRGAGPLNRAVERLNEIRQTAEKLQAVLRNADALDPHDAALYADDMIAKHLRYSDLERLFHFGRETLIDERSYVQKPMRACDDAKADMIGP